MNLDRHMIEIAQSFGPAASPKSGAAALNTAQAKKAGQDFEAIFLTEMLRPMFETIETDGPFGGGSGERVMRSMMIDEYGKAIAKNGGIGIAQAVERELLRVQEINK